MRIGEGPLTDREPGMRQQTLATSRFKAYRKTTRKTECCRTLANLYHGLNSMASLNPTIPKRETDESDWNECDACTSSDGLWQYALRTVSHAVGRTCTTCAKAQAIRLCRRHSPKRTPYSIPSGYARPGCVPVSARGVRASH